jgi:hypothetical protein
MIQKHTNQLSLWGFFFSFFSSVSTISTIETTKIIPYPITAFVAPEFRTNAEYVTNAYSVLVIVAAGTVCLRLIVDLEERSSLLILCVESMDGSSCWGFVIWHSRIGSKLMFPVL